MSWLFLLVEILAGAGLMGVGLAVVKPAKSASGYLLAAAGGILLLGGCCLFGLSRAPQSGYDETMIVYSISLIGGGCSDLVIVGLMTAAAATLAKGFKDRNEAPL